MAELDRAWEEVAPRVDGKKLSLDVRDLTYSDAAGKKVLRTIFSRSHAEFITSSNWSQYLADEIKSINGNHGNGRA